MDALVKKIVHSDDLVVAQRKADPQNSSSNQPYYSALSDLTDRLEEQKVNCIRLRLSNYWGFDITTSIPMHD